MRHILFLVMVCFGLVSCKNMHHANVNTPTLSNVPSKHRTTKEIKDNCIQNCNQIYKSCVSQCNDSCQKCQKVADKQAWNRYSRYCKQMKIQGTYRPRDWLSFRDPLQCRKVSCSCPADRNVCIQQCGGKIKKQLIETPYCE